MSYCRPPNGITENLILLIRIFNKKTMQKYKSISLILAISLVTLFQAYTQETWSPPQVYYGKGGILTYTPDEKGNIIPDFSNVGYMYGDEPIPFIEKVVEVSPVDGDDGASIQAAINSLTNIQPDVNGFRGAVLLKSGTYQVSGQITIKTSGIVLRGEGDADNGTVIIAEGTSTRDLIKIDNGLSRSVNSSSRVTIAEPYVPVGRKYVVVSDASKYAKGDAIVLYRPGTSQWITDIKMNQITPGEDVVQWSPSSYNFYFERLVTRVNRDTIFFRNPVVMAMETRYGGGSVNKYSFNRLQKIGIENLRLKSAYRSNQDEEHSWNAIVIGSAENCWVRNVSSWYFGNSCVNMQSKSKLITVENCHSREPKSIITGGRRYSFNIDGTLCLVKDCSTTEGRHDYVNGARVPGPNVFTGSTATKTHSDIGPHHRWAMGTLFDVIHSDGEINVQDRDNMGTGHGWAGANTVFWNCTGSSSICESPWTSAKNYNFGFIGKKVRKGRPDGEWVGHNIPGIFPASLYQAQLDERLKGTTVFCAFSSLTQLNDTSYLMQFSLPLVQEQLVNENFRITIASETTTGKFTVTPYDDYTITLSSATFKSLPALSVIKVKAANLTSAQGQPLSGITEASFVTIDKRPVITGTAKIINNIDGFGEATSSKTGYIYLVKYGINAKTQAALDSLVRINQGRKVEIQVPDLSTQISVSGLPGGYYQYYAADEDQSVSLPSTTWVIVEEKGPVTNTGSMIMKGAFSAFQNNGQLMVNPGDDSPFSMDIHTLTGRLIYKETNISGMQTISLNGFKGILIVRRFSGTRVETIKCPVN
jgi:hypothetical protein